MIPVLFPHPVAIGSSEGGNCSFAAYDEERLRKGVADSDRIYLLQEELCKSVGSECRKHGLPEPVVLEKALVQRLSVHPVPISELFARPECCSGKARIRICLINGGGGGYGDGILFAPALSVLRDRITDLLHSNLCMDIYSMVPERTKAVLAHLPFVRVFPMELNLTSFSGYDAFHDFSGMLSDPRFARMHMTDFYLECMGISPYSVSVQAKRPVLFVNGKNGPDVDAACKALRDSHPARPLAAMIFTSAYTRQMPRVLAARLAAGLWHDGWLPVIFMTEAREAETFIDDYGLSGQIADLSSFSVNFESYVALLSNMDAIVSVDTSAVHVGAALGKPVVGLFNSIDMKTRIAYSPTVEGIQLRFQGRECTAPCGLSKSRAYVSGHLRDGRVVAFECGYACDEAVDREGILQLTTQRLARIESGENQDQEIAAVLGEAADALHGALSPCWSVLSVEDVLVALNRGRQRGQKEQAEAAHRDN